VKLRAAIAKAVPGTPKEAEPWHGHTTLGQCSQDEKEERMAEVRAVWVPVEFEVREIAVLEKDSKGRQRVAATIPLGA